MASTFQPHIQIFKCDAAITKGQPVKFGTDSQHVAKATAASDKIIGISQTTTTTAGDLVEVALPGGGAKGLCGTAAITRGDVVTSDSSSNLVSTTTNADRCIGIAMDSAVSGDLFDVFVAAGIV